MAATENEAVVRRLFDEAFSNGKLEVLDEIMAPDSVGHAYPNELRGPEGVKEYISALRGAFPDLEMSIEDLFSQGDKVVVRYVAKGTHEGEFQGIPPTGNRFEVPAITIERFEDGKLVEGWTVGDSLGMLRQLGVLDQPTEQPEARS